LALNQEIAMASTMIQPPPLRQPDPRVQPSVPAPPSAPVQKSGHGWWLWLVLIVVIAIIGAGGIFWISKHGLTFPGASTQPAGGAGGGRGGGAVPVVAQPAVRGNIHIYEFGLGTVTPLATVTVRTRVDGEIDTINFKEGQLVEGPKPDGTLGTLLFQIDPRPYQVQLTQAEGQLAKDQAALEDAQQILKRDIEAKSAIAEQQVETQKATVDQDAAAVKIDQGQIASAQLNLTYCKITSPISGRIGLKMVDQGNIVHASDASGLGVITQLQPITVVFSLPQVDLQAVMPKYNAHIPLKVDALGTDGQTVLATGTLLAVDSQVDPGTDTFKLKASFENKNFELFPNQFVSVRILVDTIENAIVVPTAAVQNGPNNTFVYVVQPDKSVKIVVVEPGPAEGENTSIKSGLNEGDVVVTDGVDRLQDGTKVSPLQSQPYGGPVRGAGGRRGTTRPAGGATSGDASGGDVSGGATTRRGAGRSGRRSGDSELSGANPANPNPGNATPGNATPGNANPGDANPKTDAPGGAIPANANPTDPNQMANPASENPSANPASGTPGASTRPEGTP
jgi:multidrug efflux system membrane fusion protein